jgi:hypothetical protein
VDRTQSQQAVDSNSPEEVDRTQSGPIHRQGVAGRESLNCWSAETVELEGRERNIFTHIVMVTLSHILYLSMVTISRIYLIEWRPFLKVAIL